MKITNISGKFSIDCETAKTPWKQAVGLGFSGRRRNMLFLFPFERSWEFWMLGMFYPIKMIFIDGRKRVTEVKEVKPLSLNPMTWKVYAPKKPCKYVLEIPADSKYARKSFGFSACTRTSFAATPKISDFCACRKAKLFVHKFAEEDRLKW